MENILIPLERNPEENTTIDEAVDLAKKFNSKITLLTTDNTREILAEINNHRLIDNGLIVGIIGEHGLVEEENLPGSTKKDDIKYREEKIKNKSKINPGGTVPLGFPYCFFINCFLNMDMTHLLQYSKL